jgi:hypothetical protein
MRGALAGGPAPFVVNLGGGHMPVTQQLFHFHNVHAGIKQERGGGGAQRGRRVHAFGGFFPDGNFRSRSALGTLLK